MKLYMFMIRDIKADVYKNLYIGRTIGEGQRIFAAAVNDKADGNQLNSYPDDFELYVVGTVDDSTGSIEPENRLRVCLASEVKVPG